MPFTHRKTGVILLLGLIALRGVNAEELTGDVRLACEAILCLSSSMRPGECVPSLTRYFSIKEKRWSDTVSARRSFLNLCPATGEESNMQTLVEAIANGAGQCDANNLNSSQSFWVEENRVVINNTLPSWCSDYYGHRYVDFKGSQPVYVGVPEKGGFWVEPQDYEAGLKIYNERQREAAWRTSD